MGTVPKRKGITSVVSTGIMWTAYNGHIIDSCCISKSSSGHGKIYTHHLFFWTLKIVLYWDCSSCWKRYYFNRNRVNPMGSLSSLCTITSRSLFYISLEYSGLIIGIDNIWNTLSSLIGKAIDGKNDNILQCFYLGRKVLVHTWIVYTLWTLNIYWKLYMLHHPT